MTLSEMTPGQTGVLQDILIDGALGQRLVDLGFYPGAHIRMVRNAPLNDPMEVELDGYHVTLRHDEAGHVAVDKE